MTDTHQIASLIVHDACPWCASNRLETQFETIDRSGSGEVFPIVQCLDCDFVFTQKVPTADFIGPYYDFDEYISHSDSKISIIDKVYHWVRERMLKRKYNLIKKHHDGDSSRILDYGSGTGYFLNFMQTMGWDVTGVEINEHARKVAKDKFGLQLNPPELFNQLNGPFEVISLWHVLEHLYDFTDKLQEFYQKLSPGGLLILALPNHTSMDAQWLKQDWAAYDTPRHLWHFAPKNIKQMAAKYGFQYEANYAMPFDAYYVAILSNQLKRKNFISLVKGGLLGLLSNINCTFNTEKASSIIYILKKK
jgi:2-polyprenyl-3-methyl-5-hydroxy-6-metoxy-1,4-benzoquinol methylase